MKKKPVILLVDDTVDVLASRTQVLTQNGYEVLPADSGEMALAAVASRLPDLILLDIALIGMSGFDICKRLKSNEATRQIPIIFMAPKPSGEEKIEALKSGAVDYLPELLKVEELLSRVRIHLGRAENMSQDRYRDFFQMSPDGVFRFDFPEPIPLEISLNEKARLIINTARMGEFNENFARQNELENVEQLLGKPFLSFLQGTDVDIKKLTNNLVRSEFRLIEMEPVEKLRGGRTAWFELTLVGIKEGNFLKCIWGTQRDISRQKMIEEKLQNFFGELELRIKERTRELCQANHDLKLAKEAAETANLAKGGHLAEIGDEFRAPLNALLGNIDLLMKSNPNPRQLVQLRSIRNLGNTLLALVDNMRDVSKNEPVRVSPDAAPPLQEPGASVSGTPEGKSDITPGNADRTQFLSGCRTLLVEDNEYSQEIVRVLLESVGALVDVAINGREAIDKIRDGAGKSSFDIILMDIQMPVLDGIKTTRTIRKDNRLLGLPIIAMTGEKLSGEKEKALKAGMNDNITKPFDPQSLFDTIGRWIKPGPPKMEIEVRKWENGGRGSLPPEIPGMDIKAGLARLAGNRKKYLELLQSFAGYQTPAMDKIMMAILNRDWQEAKSVVHSLKETAANLGAVEVFQAAEALGQLLLDQKWDTAPKVWQTLRDAFSSVRGAALVLE